MKINIFKRLNELESRVDYLDNHTLPKEARESFENRLDAIDKQNFADVGECARRINAIVDYLEIEFKQECVDDLSFPPPKRPTKLVLKAYKKVK